MTNEQIFSSVILKILIDVEERNMKMKRILAVLLALTVFVGLLAGTWAAARLSRTDPGTTLREGA